MSKENTEQNLEQRLKRKVKINTIINIIILAGLIVLYGLYFTDFDAKPEAEKPGEERKITEISDRIGFVDMDELMDNYGFAQERREEMLEERHRLESELTNKQREFQRKVEEFQQQIQQGLISQEEAQAKEQELMQEQQELMAINEEYSERLRQKEVEYQEEVFDSISTFIGRYKEEFGFDLVLNYSPGGGVIYGEKDFEITEEVIEKINE